MLGDAGGLEGTAKGVDGVLERVPDHALELRANHAHPGCNCGAAPGWYLRCRRTALPSPRCSRVARAPPRPARPGSDGVEGRHVDAGTHVAEHGLVEVDAAQPLDALWRPQDLEGHFVHLADDRSVEGAATEVIDRNRAARLDAGLRGVVRGGRSSGSLRKVTSDRPARASASLEQRLLVRSPTGRMGHGDGVWAEPSRSATRSTTQRTTDAAIVLGAVALTADHQGDRVTETALELADHTVRMGDRAPLGGITDQELTSHSEEDHRRGRRGPTAESHGLGIGVPPLPPRATAAAVKLVPTSMPMV